MKFKLKNMEKKLTQEKNKQSNSEKKNDEELNGELKETNGKADDVKSNSLTEPLVTESEEENEILKLEAENKDLKDKFLRKVAEFENYKRRIENEQFNYFKYANESLIKDLLSILDDFERSLNYTNGDSNKNNVLEGNKLIFDKFQKILTNYGVKKIEALNKQFDVHFHEALLQVPKDGVPSHTVIEEVEKGYLLKDKVIRHTKVIVSSDSDNEKSEGENEFNDETTNEISNERTKE